MRTVHDECVKDRKEEIDAYWIVIRQSIRSDILGIGSNDSILIQVLSTSGENMSLLKKGIRVQQSHV